MKILFDGYYGYKNSGDDAFIEVSTWGSHTYWNSRENTFIGKSLPHTKHPYTGIRIKGKGLDRYYTYKEALRSDYYISAGGSTFNNHRLVSNRSFALAARIVNKKLKLGAIGVSIGPFKNKENERSIIKYLQNLDFLSLRDQRSFDFASSFDLPYHPIKAFDLAALLPSVYSHSKSKDIINDEDHRTIAISICNYERYVGGDLKKEASRNLFFKNLVELLAQNKRIHFKLFIFNGHKTMGDYEVSKELISRLNPSNLTIIPYLQDVKKTWNEIASCDFVLSTRMHASIFGCYAKIPFMLLEYHKKCTDFLEDVGQHSKYRIFDGDVDIKTISDRIQSILFDDHVYQSPTRLEETIELAKRNFTDTIKLY